MKVELLSVFYGDQYADMLFKTALPSFFLPCNYNHLRDQGFEVELRICCNPSLERYIGEKFTLPTQFKTVFETNVLRDNENDHRNRERLHIHFQEAIRRGNHVISLQPDHVFGHGLGQLVSELKKGSMVGGPHVRINSDKADEVARWISARTFISNLASNTYICGPDSNNSMVRLCMEEWQHPMVEHGKTNPEPYWRTTRRDGHWETYFKEPIPFAWWGTDDMLSAWVGSMHGSLEVLDHELVNYLWERNRYVAVLDSREGFMAEFTSPKVYLPTIRNNIWLPSCHHFNRTPALWYFKGYLE